MFFKGLIKFLNLLIKGLGKVAGVVLALLPPSPFKTLNNSAISEFLGTLNFFIPISEIVVIAETWLAAIAVYYIAQVVLRWVKAID